MASRQPVDAPTRKLPSSATRLRLLWWVISHYIILYIRKTPGKPVHGDDVIAHRATKQVDYSLLCRLFAFSIFFLISSRQFDGYCASCHSTTMDGCLAISHCFQGEATSVAQQFIWTFEFNKLEPISEKFFSFHFQEYRWDKFGRVNSNLLKMEIFSTNRYRIPIVKRFGFDSSSATRIHTTRATSWHTKFFKSNNTNDRYGYRGRYFCQFEWIIII